MMPARGLEQPDNLACLKIKIHILTLLTFLIGLHAISQTIEFVENKGQWDPRTRYIGQVNNGAFF